MQPQRESYADVSLWDYLLASIVATALGASGIAAALWVVQWVMGAIQ